MNFIDFILIFFNFQLPRIGRFGETPLTGDVSADFRAPNIFKMLDDELGTWDETSPDPKVYYIWVTTPSGNALPVIFTEEQWKMIHEVAAMSECSVEDVIIQVTKERYSI